MRKLDALRTRCGTRREDDHGRVKRGQLAAILKDVGALRHTGIKISRPVKQGLPATEVRYQHAPHRADLFDASRSRVAPFDAFRHVGNVKRLAIGFGNHHIDAALLVDERAFVHHMRHVDRDGDRADFRKGHSGRNAFGRIVELDGDVIALLHAQGEEVIGRAVDIAVELGIRERLPLPFSILELHESMVGAIRAQPFPQIAKIAVADDSAHC